MPTATRQLLPRAERRQQLLRAAASAFAHGGFGDTSMDDVAAVAGVTRLIVYRHFETKEDLYRAVLERVSGQLAERVLDLTAQVPEPRPGITVRAMTEVARSDPDGFRLLWVHAASEPAFADYAHAVREGAVHVADRLLGANIPDPVRRRWAIHASVGMLIEAVLGWLDHGEPDRDDEFIDTTNEAFRRFFAGL